MVRQLTWMKKKRKGGNGTNSEAAPRKGERNGTKHGESEGGGGCPEFDTKKERKGRCTCPDSMVRQLTWMKRKRKEAAPESARGKPNQTWRE